jgi:hypothetical protein
MSEIFVFTNLTLDGVFNEEVPGLAMDQSDVGASP